MKDLIAKDNDFIEVKTDSETFKGVLMPNSNNQTLFLKLDSGYNIGISRNKIKNMKIIKKYKEKKEQTSNLKFKKDLPLICILHTGGTVASRVDYTTGGVSPKFSPQELIEMFPEIEKIANIKSRLIANIWSQDMRFSHYNLIAKEIAKEIKNNIKGVIITQGTDTLGYTAAALAFILEDLNIPVILVGAQRSSDRGSTDAAVNLICAAHFIAKTDFSEVAICMHESMNDDSCLILPACKTRKMHTSRRDAFKVVNTKPWARVNKNRNIEFLKHDYKKTDKNRKLKLKLFKDNIKVAILKQHVNMFAEQFLFYKDYNGLVIESTGLGCLPITKKDRYSEESEKILKTIKELVKNNVIVVEAAQTIFGRICLNVYEDQRNAQQIGVLGNYNDMLAETAFIKLAWLLSNFPKDQVKELITINLRGEISERTSEDFLE